MIDTLVGSPSVGPKQALREQERKGRFSPMADGIRVDPGIRHHLGDPITRHMRRDFSRILVNQTVGEALIIDNSKWLNNVIDFDPEARTVTVEPGIVLDHLNAWLKPQGLWFPVDVSTAAQCTLG